MFPNASRPQKQSEYSYQLEANVLHNYCVMIKFHIQPLNQIFAHHIHHQKINKQFKLIMSIEYQKSYFEVLKQKPKVIEKHKVRKRKNL